MDQSAAEQFTFGPVEQPVPDQGKVPVSALVPSLVQLADVAFQERAGAFLTRRVAPFLVEMAWFDLPGQRVLLQAGSKPEDASVDDYLMAARRNLGARVISGTRVGSVLQVTVPQGVASGWALRPDMTANLLDRAGAAGGVPVVIPAGSGVLYVLGSDDQDGLIATLDEVWRRFHDGSLGDPVSPSAYVLNREGELVPLPSQNPAIDARVRRAQLWLMNRANHAAHTFLVQHPQAAAEIGPNLLVVGEQPRLQVLGDDQLTVMAWSRLSPQRPGVESILWQCTYVALETPDDGGFFVDLETFRQVCDDLLVPAFFRGVPVWRVTGWPSDEQLARLREKGAPLS